MRLRSSLPMLFLIVHLMTFAVAQSPNGTINGLVLDPSGSVIVGADVTVVNDLTGLLYAARTNSEGIYVVTNLPPGSYRIQISRIGFKTLIKPDIVLNVQDALAINFTLPIGAASETVTVEGGAPLVNTESATVSTVVDRQFAENLPLNGRSFQTLIELTPGMVVTPSTPSDPGQFSVNGQRTDANYWMVDGVSANIGASPFATAGSGVGGSVSSFSVLGGTNSLVSVDALQEFRIQTSTYAPEFGRTPGAQISIVTRSGANQFHGTVFDYFRNDVLDANDWFADDHGLPKPQERQNDFGGTFSGPILKNRTFFFFSYEGLRLRLPQTALATVPDLSARQASVAALQPYLNAFPRPNGPDDVAAGVAQFNASFSNSSSLDAYSLRIDHKLNNSLNLFGRYSDSPSEIVQRGAGFSLNTVFPASIATEAATVGVTWITSPTVTNDLRLNYSRNNARSYYYLDDFGGAAPVMPLPFPSPYNSLSGVFRFDILTTSAALNSGANARDLQRQFNLVQNTSIQKGAHGLKLGVDLRRLSPQRSPAEYEQAEFFNDVPSSETGDLLFSFLAGFRGSTLLLRNLGAYAQDVWRIAPRLTLTYGLRWDVDFAPVSVSGPAVPALTGFHLHDLSGLALAPSGTPAFNTSYGSIAPRLGLACQLYRQAGWQTVLRGGFGVFYDLATSQVGNMISGTSYPFGTFNLNFGGTFPLDPGMAAPPPFSASAGITGFDPNLSLPRTLQWNGTIEQALGSQQTASVSYTGAAGRHLIQSTDINAPNPNFASAILISNSARSDYDALQLQFQRRLSHGLQALASYTWSHSIDTASSGSFANFANLAVPALNPNTERGSSDFDIRNTISAGVTYIIPAVKVTSFANTVLRGWSIQNVIQSRSAPPVNVSYNFLYTIAGANVAVRPDLMPGTPLYLYGPYPGGKAFNNIVDPSFPGCTGPFCPPPIDPTTNSPARQGNLSRNALRGFGAAQWDLAIHRDFTIREPLRLQFRAEFFNLLNHPNFGPPVGDLTNTSQFGQSTQMLGQSLSGGIVGGGALSPLYQIGGPRSIQFALKLLF